jgi:hypothetical protein
MSAILIAVLCLAQAPTPPHPPAVTPAPQVEVVLPLTERFAAALVALRVYEASLTGLAWEQTVTEQPIPQSSGPRFIGFKSRFVVVPDGRWSLHSQQCLKPDGQLEGEKRAEVVKQLLYDGTRILEATPATKSGVIRDREGAELHEGLLSPLMLVKGGSRERVMTPTAHCLSDKLARLLEVAIDDSVAPLIRLSGSHFAGDKWERVEVDIDPARGFMPIRMTRTFELFGLLREELTVLSAENIDETWVPTAGIRTVFGLDVPPEMQALSEETQVAQQEEVDRRVAAEGLVMESHRDRLRIGAIMQATAKNPILQTHPLGSGSQILRAGALEL